MASYNARIHILLVLSSVFCLASHAAVFNCRDWDLSDVISCDDATLAMGTTMGGISFDDYWVCVLSLRRLGILATDHQ